MHNFRRPKNMILIRAICLGLYSKVNQTQLIVQREYYTTWLHFVTSVLDNSSATPKKLGFRSRQLLTTIHIEPVAGQETNTRRSITAFSNGLDIADAKDQSGGY